MTSYKCCEDILFTEVEDGAVLLHQSAGVYFGLNRVGTLIWHNLKEGSTTEACIADIVSKFDVTEKTARKDYAALIDELLSNGLIQNHENV